MPSQKGRLGGVATRDRHISLCPLCGIPTKNQHFADTGKRGGDTTLQRHGRDFYSQIGRLGGRGNTREKRIGRSPVMQQTPAKEVV
jgi:general stress protein YciG